MCLCTLRQHPGAVWLWPPSPPVQTYRATGDPRILADARRTIRLFNKFFRDKERGGFWSHVDPIMLESNGAVLGPNRARKNWNSVGDHAPAYLINLWLATGDDAFADLLVELGNAIEHHFPDFEHSPFVLERFLADWSPDLTWGWQQNRGVVGHNLKIAWNLMRLNSLRPNDNYLKLARRIADTMPSVGGDRQRGGWFDVLERTLGPGEEVHRFVWHDRKAWWQQEQGILAYLLLAGTLDDADYLRTARESAAFYNSWFLDHDAGGVFFNVLANGIPFLMGTERLKGSHSMGNYHSSELAYLAAVYTNLLVTHQPLDLHFKPKPGAFPDGLLRVQPDILPPDSVRLESVWIDDKPYSHFDPAALVVELPESDRAVHVRVRLAPKQKATTFGVQLDVNEGVATLSLGGKLDEQAVDALREEITRLSVVQPHRLVLNAYDVEEISPEAVRALAVGRQKLGLDAEIDLEGASDAVRIALGLAEMAEEVRLPGERRADADR